MRLPILLIIALLAGCTSVNRRLNKPEVPIEARRLNDTRAAMGAAPIPMESLRKSPQKATKPTSQATARIVSDADGYFVGLALSGGGSRSANFSAACMFQLQRIGMLHKVDYISSVSGGSLTAAYYCLAPDGDGVDAWNPAAVQKKLTHSFAADVLVQTLMPWNMFALLFTHYDRSDILAGTFNQYLFSRDGRRLTFHNLRADRPHLLINATDLQSGRGFVFCDEMFDRLNSDLSKYPIAHAVAASAAVPVALHHVTLQDFSTIFPQYRHLVDGGVSDNLGVKTLVEIYHAQQQAAMDEGRALPYPHGAIFIVIDAKTSFDAQLSGQGDIGILEGLKAGAGLTSTVLVNRASSATLAELILDASPDKATAGALRQLKRDLEDNGVLTLADRENRKVQVIHLALSRLKDVSDVPFTSFHERVNRIETYFNIGADEAHQLYQAADLLVREKFEAPLREIVNELARPPLSPSPGTPGEGRGEGDFEFRATPESKSPSP